MADDAANGARLARSGLARLSNAPPAIVLIMWAI
jgi:hypothetical protein